MSIFDGVDHFKDVPLANQPGEFSKGIRSGALNLGASVANAAGAIGNQMGYDQFGRSAYATADDLSQQAQAAAPRITSFRDIGAPGGQGYFQDAVDWGAGTLGSVVPSAALGIGAGLLAPASAGVAGAMAAGTAAYALPEIGDVVGRQREAGQQVDLGQAALTGGGSAALGSIVPGMVGAKVAGRMASTAPMTLRRAGATLAGEGVLEGGTEAGGDALKQMGAGRTLDSLDSGQLVDSFAGGVLGGGAMSGVGVAGEYAHGKAGAVSEGLGTAKNGATGLLASAKDKLKGAGKAVADTAEPLTDAASNMAGQAKEKLDGYDIPDRLSEVWSNTRTKAKDMLRKVAESEDIVGDAKEFAGAQGDKLRTMLAGDDDSRIKAVKTWADELAAENLSPEHKAVLDEWMASPGDHAKQAAVAGLKAAKNKVQEFSSKLKDFVNERQFKKGSGGDGEIVDMPTDSKRLGGPKKSEDFSGADQAIMREITPILQEAHPELFTHGGQEGLMNAGRAIRGLVSELSSGKQPSSDTVARLIDILGPRATDMIEAGYRAVGDSKDKGKTAAFFKGLNDMVDARDNHTDMVGVLRKNLKKEFQRSVNDGELGTEAGMLRKWAEQGRATPDDPEFAYKDRKVREALAARYENPDAVLAAVEKSIPKQDNQIERARPKTDEEGNVLGEKGGHGMDREVELAGQKLLLHNAKGDLMYRHPDHDEGRGGNLPAAATRVNRVREQTGIEPRMLTADELGRDHPLVKRTYDELVRRGELAGLDGKKLADEEIGKYVAITTEHSDSPQSIAPDELTTMRLDTHSYGKSTSRLETGEGGPILDARRMQQFMEKRFKNEHTADDEKSRMVRMGRMFIEAAAAVQDHLGRAFDVPDSTVIGRLGGKDVTLGEARSFDKRTSADVANDADTNTLVKLRKAFRDADSAGRKKILKQAGDIADKRQFAKDRELTVDDNREQLDDRLDFDGDVERGINVDKRALREQVQAVMERIAEVGRKLDGENQFGLGATEVALRKELAGLNNKLDGLNKRLERATPGESLGSGQREVDPFGQVHQATNYTEGREPEPFRQAGGAEAGMGGVQAPGLLGVKKSAPTAEATPAAKPAPSEEQQIAWINRMVARPLAEAKELINKLSQPQLEAMTNAMEDLSGPPEGVTRAQWRQLLGHAQERAFNQEAPPSPKAVAAKKAALKDAASSGDPALVQELRTSDDAAGLQRAVTELLKGAGKGRTNAAIDEANARLSELVRDNPDVSYSLMRDNQGVTPGAAGPVDRQAVRDYIKRVLGDKIRLVERDMLHAGEFERVHMADGSHEDVIRLSIHSLNPLSTAHHEALHGFFERLRDIKQGGVMDVLDRAASSAPVMNQLKKLLAGHPEALKQLGDAEERAAYMYQFWAAGKLTIGDHTRNVFQRIADFVRSVLGIWSNDERALHILDYFHQGEFAKDSTKQFARDVINEKLMTQGRNAALESAKRMTQPFREIGESLAVAGGARLRDTGIPALRELADAMKLHGTAEGEDVGFLPAARAARTQVMNDLGAKLKGASQAALTAALESLQTKSNASIDALASPEARLAARMAKKEIRKTLDSMYKYMQDRGVDVDDLGVGKDYFPRQYDASFISGHQAEFKAVLAKHGVSNPDNVMKKIIGAEGAEFTVEVDKPGMQALKVRTLAHIPDAELAPFMRKNVFEIMNSYITQATRRGEWADRFGDKNQRIDGLMQQAQREGATPEQMKAAQNFIRSVDGTLGDTINPEARRLIGNMIVYQNIRLLPLAIFSSVVDPLGVVVRGGTVREGFETFKRGMRETVKNFKKEVTDDEMTKLAASIGVIDDTTLVHTLGALYSQGMVGDTGRKINDTFFRYNLMEQFNTSMRVGATEAALNFIKRHADGSASKHSERWLQELGLQKGSVKLDANGRPDVSDPVIKMAVNRWVDGAVLRPDAVDKPIWMSDPHFALIAHLKQFVFSFHETILKRVGHEFDHGNYAPAMALASYVPVMMAADFMKGLIQGGGDQPEWKQNWELSDWVQSGIERGGLYGTGQFAVDAFKDIHRGGSGIGALVGPTLEQLTDAVRVVGGREQFGHFALKSMPANALYAKALGGEATDPKYVD